MTGAGQKKKPISSARAGIAVTPGTWLAVLLIVVLVSFLFLAVSAPAGDQHGGNRRKDTWSLSKASKIANDLQHLPDKVPGAPNDCRTSHTVLQLGFCAASACPHIPTTGRSVPQSKLACNLIMKSFALALCPQRESHEECDQVEHPSPSGHHNASQLFPTTRRGTRTPRRVHALRGHPLRSRVCVSIP